jgi:hypothetical protein
VDERGGSGLRSRRLTEAFENIKIVVLAFLAGCSDSDSGTSRDNQRAGGMGGKERIFSDFFDPLVGHEISRGLFDWLLFLVNSLHTNTGIHGVLVHKAPMDDG